MDINPTDTKDIAMLNRREFNLIASSALAALSPLSTVQAKQEPSAKVVEKRYVTRSMSAHHAYILQVRDSYLVIKCESSFENFFLGFRHRLDAVAGEVDVEIIDAPYPCVPCHTRISVMPNGKMFKCNSYLSYKNFSVPFRESICKNFKRCLFDIKLVQDVRSELRDLRDNPKITHIHLGLLGVMS